MSLDERQHCRAVELDPHGSTWDEPTRAHAAECPECVALRRGAADLAARLRGLPSLAAPLPASLRARMMEELEGTARIGSLPGSGAERSGARRRSFARRMAVPLALAASLTLGVVLGRFSDLLPTRLPEEVHRNIGMYIEDVTHDHYLLERIGRPLEVFVTDQRALSDWLGESLSFRIELPAPRAGYRLQGGRVWHTVGRLSALASYEIADGQRVVLFAVPAQNLDLDGAASSQVKGRRVFSGQGWEREARVWIDGDLAMALVAPEGRLPADWADAFLP